MSSQLQTLRLTDLLECHAQDRLGSYGLTLHELAVLAATWGCPAEWQQADAGMVVNLKWVYLQQASTILSLLSMHHPEPCN